MSTQAEGAGTARRSERLYTKRLAEGSDKRYADYELGTLRKGRAKKLSALDLLPLEAWAVVAEQCSSVHDVLALTGVCRLVITAWNALLYQCTTWLESLQAAARHARSTASIQMMAL